MTSTCHTAAYTHRVRVASLEQSVLRTAECVRNQGNGGEDSGTRTRWFWQKNHNHLHQMYQNLYEENLGEVLEFVDPSIQFAEKQEPATFLGLN